MTSLWIGIWTIAICMILISKAVSYRESKKRLEKEIKEFKEEYSKFKEEFNTFVNELKRKEIEHRESK